MKHTHDILRVRITPTFDGWRNAARRLIADRVEPHRLRWLEAGDPDGANNLFGTDDIVDFSISGPSPVMDAAVLGRGFGGDCPTTSTTTEDPPPRADDPGQGVTPQASQRHDRALAFSVPKQFVTLARRVACFRDGSQWPVLYRALWRLVIEQHRHLLDDPADEDRHALHQFDKAVRRDRHKMHAFVRFRKVTGDDGGEHFVAWYEPDHRILRLAAPFFSERFAEMKWSILTPDECVHYADGATRFTPGVEKAAAPRGDELEQLWRTYYGSIFNPARIKTKAMKAEMPVHFWKNLPEAADIPQLLADAPRREREMIQRQIGLPTKSKPPRPATSPSQVPFPDQNL